MSSGMADRGFPPPFGLLLAALELPCHSCVDAPENAMKLFSFSIAVSALTSVAVCGAAPAAPITLLPLASHASSTNVFPAYYHQLASSLLRHGGYPIAGF
jgi:hypothetical protein